MAKAKVKAQLAVQLFTLREFCRTAADFSKTLKKVKKIGYRNVQVSGIGPIPAVDVRSIADDCGVKIIGTHIGLDAFRTDLVEVIDRCHVYGCEYVAIPWMPADAVTTGAAWKKCAKEFSGYAKKAAAEGVIVQYHNHSFEMQKYKLGKDMLTGLAILYRESDPKFLQAEIDTHWIARGGGDPAAWIRSMKGRSDQVHFKDMAVLKDQPIMTEIGMGNLNWDNILAACADAGVKDIIVEQDSCPVTNNPFKSLEMSYRYLAARGLK